VTSIRRRRRRRFGTGPVRSAAVAALAALTIVGVVPDAGTAQQPAAVAELEVSLPAGAHGRRGGSVPVELQISAGDRLVAGTLQVRSAVPDLPDGGQFGEMPPDMVESLRRSQPTGPAAIERSVEVAPGTTQTLWVALPVQDTGSTDPFRMDAFVTAEVVVEATLVTHDGETLRDRARTQVTTGGSEPEVAALLPGTSGREGRPDDLPLLDDEAHLGRLVLVATEPGLLAAGPGALDPFSHVVGTPDDLAGLDPAARTSLLAWVQAGGHLVVDGDGPLTGFPDAWRLADQPWVQAGSGDIRAVGNLLAEGRWGLVLGPTLAGSPDISSAFTGRSRVGDPLPVGTMSDTLGRDAGFRLPDLLGLMVLLAVYALVAGPITFVLLQRSGRRTLAWAVVPGVVVTTSVVFLAVGVGLRPTADATHATVVELGPGGGWAATSVLVGSVPGGHVTVDLPTGWSPSQPEGGGDQGNEPVPLSAGAKGTTASVSLDPGGFALITANGPTDVPDDLEIHAVSSAGRIEVQVTNHFDVPLDDVVVLVGHQAIDLGTLGPDEERDAAVEQPLAVHPGIDDDGSYAAELASWPSVPADALANSGAGDCFDGWCPNGGLPVICDIDGCTEAEAPVVDPGDRSAESVSSVAWAAFLRHDDAAARRPGTVTVAGWTSELPSPVAGRDGAAVATGRTALVRRATIEPGDFDLLAVRRARVRDLQAMAMFGPGMQEPETTVPIYSRLVLPTSVGGEQVDTGGLGLTLPGNVDTVAFRTADGWTDFVRTPFSIDPLVVPIPDDAVVGGVVNVRTTGDFWLVAEGGTAEVLETWSLRALEGAERAEVEAARAADAERRSRFEATPP